MKSIIAATLLLLLTGCGIRTEVVRVNVPDIRVNPEQGTSVVVAPVTDHRPTDFLALVPAADRARNVGGEVRQGNGFNLVLESTTTAEKTREIIIQALRNMGYRTIESCEARCLHLQASMNQFAVRAPFNFWRAAGWAQQMVADISVEVTTGEAEQSRSFVAKGHGTNVFQVVSPENWEKALERAVTDFTADFKQKMAAQE
ncbi:hypothetical protein [Stenotrophomonas sp. YAU14D1_LEIMI4_1]|uniref:hypothetical protein n=1 Tax=Stenotrophomonas sp. YAU14D1_LEIMI4_1 TaxID=2072407 RepID=UPI000D5429FE|nr:hypothetical protein [Stenotrophomonas sp. YAU14D1_LEIMI4_1]AWH27082.1 hypothetical protein C1932_19230 [Stenotrophomonas sp. YAU14D1_LEIMI4_1]